MQNHAGSHDRADGCAPSSLIITHTGYILDYVKADIGYILHDGTLHCRDNPNVILEHIREHGYRECIRCLQGKERI